MQTLPDEKIDFSVTKTQEKPNYDLRLVIDPNRSDELIEFVAAFYANKADNTMIPIEKKYFLYQQMTDTAICFNNMKALNILWKGIYFHDRDNPDYEHDVYTAARYGNLATFQSVLYGYLNYITLNGVNPLKLSKLKEMAGWNKETLPYIKHIAECFVNDKLSMTPDDTESIENEMADENDGEMLQYLKAELESTKRLYTLLRNFTPK